MRRLKYLDLVELLEIRESLERRGGSPVPGLIRSEYTRDDLIREIDGEIRLRERNIEV